MKLYLIWSIVLFVGSVLHGKGSGYVDPASLNFALDGGWSSWTNGPCSVTCRDQNNKTTYNKTRTCDNGGNNCTGNSSKTVDCSNITDCPVDGGWSSWINGLCSVTCRGQNNKPTYNKTRTCDTPTPLHGGNNCTGNSSETVNCSNITDCPEHKPFHTNILPYSMDDVLPYSMDDGSYTVDAVATDGMWSFWSQWSKCNVKQQIRQRFRSCTNPSPSENGNTCSGNSIETGNCAETKRKMMDNKAIIAIVIAAIWIFLFLATGGIYMAIRRNMVVSDPTKRDMFGAKGAGVYENFSLDDDTGSTTFNEK